MKQAIVVIPIYSEKLKPTERLSLRQARKFLSAYDICFMAPEKMRFLLQGKGYMAEYWPDPYFANVRGYSRLLLTEEFYQRFASYEYMLLYQLDAFVFSDRLSEFCKLGYDYIGAPMPWQTGAGKHVMVGNGGLSLRRINACARLVRQKQDVYTRTGRGDYFEHAEDRLFCYAGVDEAIQFSVPPISVALDFAIEYDVRKCYANLPRHLPFGCHGWSKPRYFPIWQNFIREDVPADEWVEIEAEVAARPPETYFDFRHRVLARYFMKRLLRQTVVSTERIIMTLPLTRRVIVWGMGQEGKQAVHLLSYLGFEIVMIMDSAVKAPVLVNGIRIVPAHKSWLEVDLSVILATSRFAQEIQAKLKEWGLTRNKNFFLYTDIEVLVTRAYISERRIMHIMKTSGNIQKTGG